MPAKVEDQIFLFSFSETGVIVMHEQTMISQQCNDYRSNYGNLQKAMELLFEQLNKMNIEVKVTTE